MGAGLLKDDHISRAAFANTIAGIIISTFPREAVQELVARGFDDFLANARHVYAGHALQYDDFKSIFEDLRLASLGKATVQSVLRRLR